MSDLRTGKWICEQKGIPTQKLITACNSGKIAAYSPNNGQEILASSQCRKKFLFHDKLYFSLITKKYGEYIAIKKDDLIYFNIYLGKLFFYPDGDNRINRGNTLSPNLEVVPNSPLSIRGYHVLHEFQRDNEGYLFFLKSKCDIYRQNDIYKYVDYLYRASEIILEPKKEGIFTLRFLALEPHQEKEDIREVDFSIKMVTYGDDSKLILDDYNDNYISIHYNQIQCIECNMSPVRDKNPQNNVFSKTYINCYRYFHQYKLDYFKPNDKEFKNPLKLRTDFFIFDYKEYCQQTYLQQDDESKRNFYEYIESLFFDINELENIFIEDFEDDDILNDPLAYMKLKCISLLKKHKDFNDDKRIIMAFLITIDTDIPYSELHDIFFPSEINRDSSLKTTYFSKYLDKFAGIAIRNHIPSIKASKFRNITTLEGKEELIKKLKEQLAAIRAKRREKPKP